MKAIIAGRPKCWYCNRQLVKEGDTVSYWLIEDPAGNRMKVHRHCLKFAVGDGFTEVRENDEDSLSVRSN